MPQTSEKHGFCRFIIVVVDDSLLPFSRRCHPFAAMAAGFYYATPPTKVRLAAAEKFRLARVAPPQSKNPNPLLNPANRRSRAAFPSLPVGQVGLHSLSYIASQLPRLTGK
jgi:hypothetical protein